MRIFIPPQEIKGHESITLPPDKSRYLTTVLRRKRGDRITVIDGRGKAYEAEVIEIARETASIAIVREIPSDRESLLNLILCQGVLKGEKMDMVIQKTTELGIAEIVPLITERCLVRETRKLTRWRKIAEEAAEQCGRAIIPAIHEPRGLASLLECGEMKGTGGKLYGCIFWEEGGMPLQEAMREIGRQDRGPGIRGTGSERQASPVYLLIGPEGGFTAEEVRLARERGLIRTTLGRRILRAETAAIASVALVHYLLEDNLLQSNGRP